MRPKVVRVKEHCGDDCVSREDGLRLRDWIKKQWPKNDQLVFDFSNILIASVSSMDEAFAKLALEYSKDEIVSKLKFENLQPFARALLNDLVKARLKEREKELKKRAKKRKISPKAKAKNKRAKEK